MEQFHFQRTNETVTKALTPEEINGVLTWQTNLGFEFEFHDMHEAGHPCYLRERDLPRRGLPKINLLDYDGVMYQQDQVRVQENMIESRR